MALQRKPFVTPGSVAAGQEAMPGMPPMPPQAGRMGAQPPTPMGGNPGMQGPPSPQPDAGGGPMAPGNISQMLHAKLGAPPLPPGAAPTAGVPSSLPPWGDQGARPEMGAGGPARVPFNAGVPNPTLEPGVMGGPADRTHMVHGRAVTPAMLLQLLHRTGRV